jgi:hypothetical protein
MLVMSEPATAGETPVAYGSLRFPCRCGQNKAGCYPGISLVCRQLGVVKIRLSQVINFGLSFRADSPTAT